MAAEKVPYSPEIPIKEDRPRAGKREHIPGDRRRTIIDGRVYMVRAWDTFVAEQDAYRYSGRKIDVDTIEEVVDRN